ncbi:hypothetical protein PC116_g33992 [Phytophthora cactorum]|nr:hypothetical protein PC116_g33992 [Phytophthora cactorum]
MTDSGKCVFVLGIELVDGPDGSVTMCQWRYVDDILKRFGMDECKAVVSPADMSTRLVPSDAATKVNAPFREAVGALMHLIHDCYSPGYCVRGGLCVALHGEPSRGTLGCGQAHRSLPARHQDAWNLLQAGRQHRLSRVLRRGLGWRPRGPQVDFRLHVHADGCACELGQQEAVKCFAVYE